MGKSCFKFDFISTSCGISMGAIKKLLILFFMFFSYLVFTQNLAGNWLNVKEQNIITDPNIHLIWATEKSLSHKDFKKKLFTEPYYVKGASVFCNDTLRYRINELDSELLTLGYVDQATGETVFKAKYVRLQTSEKEGPVEMIQQNTYILTLNNEVIKIQFGKLLEGPEVFNLGDHQCGNFLNIEEIEGIYFLTVYLDDLLIKVYPIRSLSEDKLVIYGFYEQIPDKEIVARLHMDIQK